MSLVLPILLAFISLPSASAHESQALATEGEPNFHGEAGPATRSDSDSRNDSRRVDYEEETVADDAVTPASQPDNPALSASARRVAACQTLYRSYNPSTDTVRLRSGETKRCPVELEVVAYASPGPSSRQ